MTDIPLGTIAADFQTLRAAYPTYRALPKHIADYMAALNQNLPEGAPRNTPCCFQMSEALNAAGAEHRIPGHGHRRRFVTLNGNHYIGAVDELEVHLTGRYGAGQDLRAAAGASAHVNALKALIRDRQGILVFRDRGYGFHTELWDGRDIIQNGAPGTHGAAISSSHCFIQPRVLFWQLMGDDGRDPLPDWLCGWWLIDGTPPLYYYISDQHVVTYTRRAPATVNERPMRQRVMEGVINWDQEAGEARIVWNDGSDGELSEVMRQSPGQPNRMEGRVNDFLPFVATRVTFAGPAPAGGRR